MTLAIDANAAVKLLVHETDSAGYAERVTPLRKPDE